MCNITFANCVNYKELKGVISQNAHKLVKTNGKYIGFLLEDNAFTSTISLEINDDIQILSSKKISQIRKDKVKLQKFTLFYINISDLKNSHNIGIPKNPVNCKLLD